MTKDKKKRKNIVDYLTYAYIRKVKKWMFCPACQQGKMVINKKSTMWICEDCGYKLSTDEFEDDYVFWFCDECNSYLNNQEGFDIHATKHVCQKCGYENDTTFDNVKGVCIDCGKIIPDSERTLCEECRQVRRQKAKEWLITAGKVVGAVAIVAGTIYLASQAVDNDETTDYTPISEGDDDKEDLKMNKYPVCKSCGSEMSEFDGWAWYTCKNCGNSVRIIDRHMTWYDEIFDAHGKKELYSDYELADFCRGGELSEE